MVSEAGEKLDQVQVKKAVQALLAYTKKKGDGDALLLNEHDNILLMVTVWKIPEQDQCFKIPLPHGIRPETSDVCLFTRDEPNMTAEQTEAFYKKLLNQHGIKQITQIIPYKTLKKEYKPYEAKLRLLKNFDLFLSDDRIRRLLPSHIGKHFYKSKKAPLSVSLKEKNLSQTLNKIIQGTTLSVNSKGCCYAARIGHTGMKVEELVENIKSSATVIGEKLPKKWKNVKLLHLKTTSSVALPIFTSNITNVDDLDTLNAIASKEKKPEKKRIVRKRRINPASKATSATPEATETKNDGPAPIKSKQKRKEKTGKSKISGQAPVQDDDEEIPQLVPIASPKAQKRQGKKGGKSKKPSNKESQTEVSAKPLVSKKPNQENTKQKRKASQTGVGLTAAPKPKKFKIKKRISKESL
ncbi:ribosomal L1 domain-containing protein 1 [Lissotriton helveticus]